MNNAQKEIENLPMVLSELDRLTHYLNKATRSKNRKYTLTFFKEMQKYPTVLSQKTLNEALIISCSNGNKFLVKTLLLFNVDIDCKNDNGNTPLMLCAINSFCDIAIILIQRGADVNCVNDHGDSALILSVANSNSIDMVEMLLEQEVIAIFIKNIESETCLSKAVELLDFEAIQIILKKAISKRSSRNYKKMYSQTITHAQSIARNLGVINIFNYLEKEISENKSTLLQAVFYSDLDSFNIILSFNLTKELSRQSVNEGLIFKVLKCYDERKTGVNDKDIEIIRKLLEIVPVDRRLDDSILAKAVNIGNPTLLDLLCQFVYKSKIISPNSFREIYYNGLTTVCKKGSCIMLKIILLYTPPDFTIIEYQRTELTKYVLANDFTEFTEMFLSSEKLVDLRASLFISIMNDEIHIFNFIVEKYRGKAVSLIQDTQSYVIHKASELGNKNILMKLFELGANVNIVFQDKTPLMYCRNTEIARLLIQNGADVNLKVDQRSAILSLYLEDFFRDVNETLAIRYYGDDHNKAAEMYRIEEKKRNLLTLFLEQGANIEDKDSNGQTALILASRFEFYEQTLRFLLKAGADPDNFDNEGRTALHLAISENRLKNVETILKFGPDVNKKCQLGMSCLHLAAKNGNLEIVKMLLDHGADVNVEHNKGNTPLFSAAGSKHASNEVINLLIDAGSIIDHQNEEGNTALMTAAEKVCLISVVSLCKRGASINTRRFVDNKNAVDILVEKYALQTLSLTRDLFTCTNYLLEHGGSAANIKTEHLYQLILDENFDIIRKLIMAGLSPSECPVKHTGHYTRDLSMLSTVSPFCYAILKNKVELAKYFNDILFLTTLDISDRERVKIIRIHLSRDRYKQSLDFLDEFTSQPISLQKMCLISVSTAVGSSDDRKEKINVLRIPSAFKDKLLFRSDTDLINMQGTSCADNNVFNSFAFAPYFLGFDPMAMFYGHLLQF